MTYLDAGNTTPADIVAAAPRKAHERRKTVARAVEAFGLVFFLIALSIVFMSMTDRFLTPNNFQVVLSSAAVIGIVSIGQTFVIISGGFDLSVAGIIPTASVVFALLVNADVPFAIALLCVLVVGAAIGIFNGLLVTRLKISPLIVTLATASITGGAAFVFSSGLAVPFDNLDNGVLAARGLLGLPNPIWLFLGVAVAGLIILRFTIYGRQLYAIGGNTEASRLAGMRVSTVVTFVYALSGLLAALAGVVLGSQLLSGSGNLGSTAALTSVAAAVLGGAALTGGVGSVMGTVVGVLILGVLSNGLALLQVSSFYQTIATGVVLLLAVGLGQLRTRLTSR